MRNYRLTSLALLLLGLILNSCGKDSNGGDDPNNPAGQGGGPDDQYKIVFTTAKAIGEEINIVYDTFTDEDMRGVWIDLNNNGVRENGEFSPGGGAIGFRNIGSQTLTIYGKIKRISLKDKKITSIDTSKNIKLEELVIEDNPIKTLDLTHNPNLKKVHVTYRFNVKGIKGGLESLSISADKNSKLEELLLSAEEMKMLDISNFPKLKRLVLEGSIENLKITNNPNLDVSLTFIGGTAIMDKVKNLEIKNNAKKPLSINATNIESIDVSDSPDLEDLSIFLYDVNNPALKRVKLLNTPKLKDFRIGGISISLVPYNISFCVQADAHRVNNLPERWDKSGYNGVTKGQTTINYRTTSCL